MFGPLVAAMLSLQQPGLVQSVWREMPAYILMNEHVEAVIVPQYGRVMEFRRRGMENVLWAPPEAADTSGWVNRGGDKVWVAPQDLWGWPPDPAFDGLPHEASVEGEWLVLTSQVSAKLGVQVVRRMRLVPGEPVLESVNTIKNLGSKPVRASPWQVAQLNDPESVIAAAEPTRQRRELIYFYDDKDKKPRLSTIQVFPDGVVMRRHPTEARKVGVFNRTGLLAIMKGGQTVWMKMDTSRREEYPDFGSPWQVYANPDPNKYVEIEAAGPLKTIRPGQSTSVTVRLGLGL